MSGRASTGPAPVDTDQDRHPTFAKLLRRILADDTIPEGPIARMEVSTLASGEATWRVWPVGADEPIGGYYSNSELL